MSKIWYKLVFKQINAVHIGKSNYGVLSETRIFIPGWTIWGALVNRYGKEKGGQEENFEEGKEIFKSITCFYPCFEEEGKKVLFPEYKNGQFYLGDYSEDEFRLEFTDVYVSTAIQPQSLTAKDESLHELEVILPKSRHVTRSVGDTKQLQMYWVGLLGIEENSLNKINNIIGDELQIIVGGDRRYGLGNLKLVLAQKAVKEELEEWGITQERKFVFDKPLRNYMNFSANFLKKGKIEHIIVEADFSKCTPTIKESMICIVPGSRVIDGTYELNKGIFVGT